MKDWRTYLRYSLPLWLVALLTDWLPEHHLICKLRGALARPFLGSCGSGFELGSAVVILSPERLTVGNHVYVARGSWLNCIGEIELADEVIIGPYVVMSTLQYQAEDNSFKRGDAIARRIRIGRGTWLGSHVSVKAGVDIGAGNLVGANACVVSDTPQLTMVGGVPAKLIRTLTHQ